MKSPFKVQSSMFKVQGSSPVSDESQADAAWLARCRAYHSADRRNRALILYNPLFARWQAQYDPLFRALVSLRRELASPYKDVPSVPLSLPSAICHLP